MIEKTARITVRFLPADADRIAEQAEQCNLTMAEFVRRRALGTTIHTPYSATDEESIRILRRTIGLIKQIYKNEIADKAQTYAVLKASEAAINRIAGGRHDIEEN